MRAALTWPLAAVAVVALMGARAARLTLRPDEGLLAAEAFLLSSTRAEAAAPALSPDGLGALHVAVYATLTRAFPRYDTLAAVGREVMLVAAICSAVLLWRTARRLGLGILTSAGAVLLAGVPPLLSAAALVDIPAQLAVPWLLLATLLMAPGRSTAAARAVALIAATIASLLAPDVLLIVLAGAAAALCTGRLLPRTALRVRLVAALLLVAVLVVVALLLPGWDPQPGISALAVVLPFAALGTAALAQALLASLPVGGSRALRIAAAGAVAGALIAALVLLVRTDQAVQPTPGVRAVLTWSETQLPEEGALVAPRYLWAELIHAGGDENQVRLAGADKDDADLSLVRGDASEGTVVARFDSPGAPGLRVVDPAPGTPTPEELDRRQTLGAALLANPTTGAGGQTAERLRAGAVDPRLLTLLAALGAQYGVGVADFPAAPGEPQDGLLARSALVERLGDDALLPSAPATERLVAWLEAQLPPFAPDSFEVTDNGVLIDFRYVSAPDAQVTRSTE